MPVNTPNYSTRSRRWWRRYIIIVVPRPAANDFIVAIAMPSSGRRHRHAIIRSTTTSSSLPSPWVIVDIIMPSSGQWCRWWRRCTAMAIMTTMWMNEVARPAYAHHTHTVCRMMTSCYLGRNSTYYIPPFTEKHAKTQPIPSHGPNRCGPYLPLSSSDPISKWWNWKLLYRNPLCSVVCTLMYCSTC